MLTRGNQRTRWFCPNSSGFAARATSRQNEGFNSSFALAWIISVPATGRFAERREEGGLTLGIEDRLNMDAIADEILEREGRRRR